MPKFIESVANQQMPPPYYFPGATVNAFLFEAPLANIQKYCDDYFNLGDAKDRGFTYKAFGGFPYAALMVIEYPQMICADARPIALGVVPFASRGYSSQSEIFVAAPVIRYGTSARTFLPRVALEWTLPFLVVDNSTSSFSGREMIGLEKLQGSFELGESEFPGSFRCNVSLPGWRSLRSDEMQQSMPFVDIETDPPVPTIRGAATNEDSVWTLLRSRFASAAIEGGVAFTDLLDVVSAGTVSFPMNVVSLKQFRDATDPSRAVYQALAGARSRYSNITKLQFYNEQNVDITFHDRGSFSEIIQVFLNPQPNVSPYKEEDTPVRVKTVAAYRFEADINYDNTRTLHNFPVDGQRAAALGSADGLLSPFLKPLAGFIQRRAPDDAWRRGNGLDGGTGS